MSKIGLMSALVAVVTLGSGCFSKTMIYSKPSGAKVTIDNTRSLGTTPVELDEQVWIWTKHNVVVQAEGYAPQTVQIRSTGLNMGYAVVCVCSLGLLAPLGLTSQYPKQYVVELQPAGTKPAEAEPGPAQAALNDSAAVSFR